MKSKSDFHLSKWYLDIVDNDGKVFIGYFANLKWKSFSFNYSSFLLHSNNKTLNKITWRRQPAPHTPGNSIRWISPRFDIEAEWIPKSKPIKKNLLSDGNKSIQWDCICPSGEGKVKVGEEKLSGLGYVEHLEMTIRPWQLPFNELRWGRYISEKNYLVWIDWQGEQKNKWIFRNDVQMDNGKITDEIIFHPKFNLQLIKTSTLRQGNLLSTAINRIPKNFSIIPKSIFNSYECKWLSKGVLTDNNSTDTGWSIHEVIKWK